MRLQKKRTVPARPVVPSARGAELLRGCAQLAATAAAALDALDLRLAIGASLELARRANRVWEEERPWTLRGDAAALDSVLFCAIECVRVIMTALQPVIPSAADAVLSGLGVPREQRAAQHMRPLSVATSGNDLSRLDSFILLPKREQKKSRD
jgi:methionyl-tRNA synthetase